MKINTVQCDICKAMRKETNNWWKGFILKEASGKPLAVFLTVAHSPLANLQSELKSEVDLCGIDCCQKWSAQQLDKILNTT